MQTQKHISVIRTLRIRPLSLPMQVNNACSTGSTALYMAKQFIQGGKYVFVLQTVGILAV